MPIAALDIRFRLSGGALNADQAASLGGPKSIAYANASIFDAASNAELSIGKVEYRCIYVQNEHASLPLEVPTAWVDAKTGASSIGIDIGVGSSALGATEPAVWGEGVAPSGVAFLAASDETSAISLGSIPAGQSRALWIRRTIPAGSAVGISGFTLRLQNLTPPVLAVPDAPIIGVATAANREVTVTATAPLNDGGSAVIEYQFTLSDGSSKTVTGLMAVFTGKTNGVTLTGAARARNVVGWGSYSAQSNAVTPSAGALAGSSIVLTRSGSLVSAALTALTA